MTTSTETNRKYFIRAFLFMGSYAAINIAAITGAFDDMKPRVAWGFSLAVAAPVVGHIWAYLAWMRDSDEFVRTLTAKRFIIATGITIAISSVWGLMEIYAKAPHISAAMVYPLLWAAFGVVSPFIRTSH